MLRGAPRLGGVMRCSFGADHYRFDWVPALRRIAEEALQPRPGHDPGLVLLVERLFCMMTIIIKYRKDAPS